MPSSFGFLNWQQAVLVSAAGGSRQFSKAVCLWIALGASCSLDGADVDVLHLTAGFLNYAAVWLQITDICKSLGKVRFHTSEERKNNHTCSFQNDC